MFRFLYDCMPSKVRSLAKAAVARSGHRKHFLDPIRARHLAKTKKRMEVVAHKMEQRLAIAGMDSLHGMRCMEFGCGMVPTELVYFWTVGAKHLIAVDYNDVGRFAYLPCPAGFSSELIDYKAPFDFSKARLHNINFIHSESVLEHVAPWEVGAVLRNLAKSLSPNGVMIHSIDLRDHLDPVGSPFGFMGDPEYEPSRDFDARGNRMRRSDWIRAFAELPDLLTTCHREVSTPGRAIPDYLDDDSALFVVMISKRINE